MSRRKQARPIRVCEEDGEAPATAPISNGEGSATDSEDDSTGARDDNVCENCNAEFPSQQEAEDHRKECSVSKEVDSLSSPGDEEDEEASLPEEGKRQEEVRRQRQDAENNNSVEEGETENEGDIADTELPMGFPFQLPAAAAAGHVTLEALQNTKVAVAQFAATAMANNSDNAAALQELAVLQSTLYTLQHQQMMQLNLIQQLQQQLQITRPKDSSPTPPPAPSTPTPTTTPTPAPAPEPAAVPKQEPEPVAPTTPKPPTTSPPMQYQPNLPPCSISSSFASSIINNLDPPPSPSEPNTLEMLQRRAQEVLDNASQGLLANNLADELAFRKSGGKSLSPYDSKTGGRNEPFFKHRCRYCGKVFGSDSALQIHIRSHTGERPFKCNVCGSRFTTKGNLKVHFQRHTTKFPHIKMNPNPVPEHLDKYHPPLLAQMSSHQNLPPGVPPHHPHSQPPHHQQFPGSPPFPPTALPMFRPQHDLVMPPHPQPLIKPVLPIHLFGPRPELHQDTPENLTKPVLSTHSASPPPEEQSGDMFKKEMSEDEGPIPLTMCTTETGEPMKTEERLSPKVEAQEGEGEQEPERYSPMPYEECSSDSKYSNEELLRDSPSLQDQPENLSNKTNGEKSPSHSGSEGQLTPSPHLPAILPRPAVSPATSESGSLGALDLTPRTSASSGLFSGFGLLPTSALSSLTSSVLTSTAFSPMGLAVGHTVRGNTTCNICFKTFACHSALEIHYRSHTKERPFKCTICDRGFSTKGNMKQHMLTHKIRDMPSHLFEQKSPLDETSNTSTESRDTLVAGPGSGPSPGLNLAQAVPRSMPSDSPLHPHQNMSTPHQHQPHQPHQPQPPLTPHQPHHVPPPPHQTPQMPKELHHQPPPPPQPIKRSPPEEAILPIPKRQPSLPKHLCHVCNKNFSSSSALQIHMRTHTGDKPFRCTICHKAFTTKGNLKVHMGTHMWTNGASRRGRRMSLDLPPMPITQKDSDFLHRRPDLFYPYLPAPFLNGMQQKLNEISVIQNVGSNMTNRLLGFGGYGGNLPLALEMKPVSPNSDKQPMSPPRHRNTPPLWDLRGNLPLGLEMKPGSPTPDKQQLSPPRHRTTPPLWDLHYERKPAPGEERMDCQSPPSHVPLRGEGLAA